MKCKYENCTGITSLIIPNSIAQIDGKTFKGCSSLKSVTFSDGLYGIRNSAFDGCTGLESIIIPNSVSEIDAYAFQNCSKIETIDLGNGVKKIGWGSFNGCVGLKNLFIPNSVTDIGIEAFYGCKGLKKIYLGSGLKSINYRAFAECQDIETVYSYAEELPYTTNDIFKNSYIEYATLYVPLYSLDKYMFKDPWRFLRRFCLCLMRNCRFAKLRTMISRLFLLIH